MDSFGQGGFDLTNLVSSLGSRFSTPQFAEAVRGFFKNHSADVAGTMHAVNQGYEAIAARQNWITTGEEQSFCTWLSE
jgi:hypothetical protein